MTRTQNPQRCSWHDTSVRMSHAQLDIRSGSGSSFPSGGRNKRGSASPATERGALPSMTAPIFKPLAETEMKEMMYPNWRESPPYVNVAITEDAVLSRMQEVALQRNFAMQVQQSQRDAGVSILCPCNWCGQPSGDWCESCAPKNPGAAHTLCAKCDSQWIECRLCRLERQLLQRNKSQTHRIRNGAWLGSNRCGGCDEQQMKMRLCEKCGLTRYCGQQCQKKHWGTHRSFCEFFSTPQPLTIVYPWHEERAMQVTRGHEALFPPVRFPSEMCRSSASTR